MSRQSSGFHGHRDRRENQRQYGIGPWYGTGDYYTTPSNSNEFGLPPKRPRYGVDRFKDRHEVGDEGAQYIQQEADYGLYTDFTDKVKHALGDSPAGRNFTGRRPSNDFHHGAHRIPKNFWSSENATYPSSFGTSTTVPVHHQAHVYEQPQGSRADMNYSWRTHGYPPKNPDIRPKTGIYTDPAWFRSEEARAYAARGRASYGMKPVQKFPTHRDPQKPGFNRYGRKFSESDTGPSGGQELFERNAGQKEYHIPKKQSTPTPENKTQEFQKFENVQRYQRGEERERNFSEGKYSHEGNIHKEMVNDNNMIAGESCDEDAGTKGNERWRSEATVSSSNKMMHEGISCDAACSETVATGAHEGRKLDDDSNGLPGVAQQPRFEDVSPVPAEEGMSTKSANQMVNECDNEVSLQTGHGEIADEGEAGHSVGAPDSHQGNTLEPPKNEEEVISKLDSMDKEIVECEEDIKNLGQIEHQLEEELIDLKKEVEENESENETQVSDVGNEAEKDPKDELKDYFIEKIRPKDFELIMKIYKDNQIKAKLSHADLWSSNFVPEPSIKPLYYQPSDLPFYFDNIRRHKRFRMKLIKFLQMKKIAQNKKEEIMKQLYEQQKEGWLKKLERIENNIRRKAKLSKVRAFYEREFPEIKRQREQQERMTRFGARTTWGPLARSEAEFEEIVDNLSELEATEKQMHQLAVEPPKLLDRYERRAQYSNRNGLIVDLEAFEKERKFKNIWCEEEKAIFKERFMQFPKDFERIAEGLKRKTVPECVLYYYRNKKKDNFKATSKKPSKKTGRLQRQLVSTLTYAQPLPNIESLQQPQPVKTRQKERERERERLKEQDNSKDHGGERQRVLRSDVDNADRNEGRTTRELRSSDEKAVEQLDLGPSNENSNSSKLVTPQMEAQCKQTVDDLIARYLARKPLPAENVDPSRWSELEISKAIEGLKCHGRNWPAISRMVHTKSEAQCKNFYFNYKRKFHLESILGISKHHMTSYHREGSATSNEDEMVSRKRRTKRPVQPEREVNGDYSQGTEQSAQEKPVDVEEVETGQSTLQEKPSTQSAPESRRQENNETMIYEHGKEEKDNSDDITSKDKDIEADDSENKSENIADNRRDDEEIKHSEEASVLIDSESLVPSHQNLLQTRDFVPDKPQATAVITDGTKVVSSEERFEDQIVKPRPDSLHVNKTASQAEVKIPSSSPVSIRAQPPPLTPVVVEDRQWKQSVDPNKAGSPSSLLKEISLQSEIGAFRETLERTLDKKNELSNSKTAVDFRGEVDEQQNRFPVSTVYSRLQGDSRLQGESRLVGQIALVKQKYHDIQKRIEPYSFIPSSSMEQSAAIQAFAGRQPSLMSLQQSHVRPFGQLSQEAAAIQKHYQHSHLSGVHDNPQNTTSPAASLGHTATSHGLSPTPATSTALEHHQLASSRPSHLMFAASSAHSIHNVPEHVRHSEEQKFPSITEYPGMPRKGVLFTSTTNPSDMFMRHKVPFESYHSSMVSPTDEPPFPYHDPRYSLTVSDARVRAYGEILERSASIPSLRHLPTEAPKPSKSLSKDNISHIGQQSRDKTAATIDQRQQQLYYDVLMSSRIENRSIDRREQMAEQTRSQAIPREHPRQVRKENLRIEKRGTESMTPHGSERGSASPVTAIDPRMANYLPNNLPGHMSQFMKDQRPTLDQQLLKGIDGRNVMNTVYHHPSVLHRDDKMMPGRQETISKRDECNRQFEMHPRMEQRGVIEKQHIQTQRDSRNMYDDNRSLFGVSNVASSQTNAGFVSESKSLPAERHYGISTGLVQKAPAQMSITGQHHDDMIYGRELRQLHANTSLLSLKKEDLDHLAERGSIQTKRTSTIKHQSKNTRPSSVDSVIHKSFLSERQQQLSTSLGDLRNLTALHLSPNLPLSPLSASHTSRRASFMFRPWEKEMNDDEEMKESEMKEEGKVEGIAHPSVIEAQSQQQTGDDRTTRADERPTNTGIDTAFDEPLMSPTIPYTDHARDTPVKDIITTSDETQSCFTSNPIETSIHSAINESRVYLAQDQVTGFLKGDNADLGRLLKIAPRIPSEDRPESPVDSEATLSADESEMVMMQDSLDEREDSSSWSEMRSQRRVTMEELFPTGSLEGRGLRVITGVERFEGKNNGGNLEKPVLVTQIEQNDVSADLEVSKITNQHEQKVKLKAKKKQKSSANRKKKSPKRNIESCNDVTVNVAEPSTASGVLLSANKNARTEVLPNVKEVKRDQFIPSNITGNDFESTVITSELLAKNEGQPPQGASSLLKISPSNLYDDITNSSTKEEADASVPESEAKASKRKNEEEIGTGNESNDVNDNESQNMLDLEETSAAIDSIKDEGQDSPSAEEESAEPYLTLWSSTEGYPCEGQTVSVAGENDYHQDYDTVMRGENVTEEKELTDNYDAEFMKEQHGSHEIEGDSGGVALELQTRLPMDVDLGFQQAENVMLPSQAGNGIFLPDFETTPISPPGSPISPVEVPTIQNEATPSDIALSFSHSVLSLNIAVTSQNSPRAPVNPVAFPYSTLSFPYSTLSSMPASRPGSLHGSASSSTCPSPNPLANIQNSPSYATSSTNLMPRIDFQQAGQNGDNLRNLTEKLLYNDLTISHDDHMTVEESNRANDSSDNFSSAITYEPLSDED